MHPDTKQLEELVSDKYSARITAESIIKKFQIIPTKLVD